MKFSIGAQIEEVERELGERKRVYANLVASRKMRQSIADFQMARMEAVLATLQWLQANELDIRAGVEAAKAKRRAEAESGHGDPEGS